MSKNEKKSAVDYTNAITDSHNEESKALNVVAVNSLVPARYGKVELTYINDGSNSGSVSQARYYSNGAYQETQIQTIGDAVGSAHKTTLNFNNKTANSLSGKAFVLFDDVGAVGVWFNVDFSSEEPDISNTYRKIEVNLISSNNPEAIASRVATKLKTDIQFLAVSTASYVIVSSVSTGIKEHSYDQSTGVFVKNTGGTNPVTLNNKYFYLNAHLNSTEYYVWYSVNNAGIDPQIAGKTGLRVNINKGSDPQTVAIQTKNVLDSTGKFITNINSDTLLISNVRIGITSLASEQSSGFLVFTKKLGENRELLVTLEMQYNEQGNISSVERV